MNLNAAYEDEVQNEDTMHGRYLSFNIEAELYALQIRFVTEIIGMQPITKLPEAPAFIKGIINLRGRIIPVIDVRLRFGKEAAEYTDRTCIIVIQTGEISAGLIVDNVAEVFSLNEEQISPPPSAKAGIHNRFIEGIGRTQDRISILLDCEKLFTNEEMTLMSESAVTV